ncbi:MAG: hypothetical protein COB84_08005 [Rhodobacteraceae bacterium]|nr:MAG: hypothetical protein COB84_08005 [Paracoccaceae bacterium]
MQSQAVSIDLTGASSYPTTLHLDQGEYLLNIVAPFDTRVVVTPVAGIAFRDLDPSPNVYSAEFTVSRAGSYTFNIVLDKPVENEHLYIHFEPKDAGGNEDDGSESNPLPDFPLFPTAGWRFVYMYRKDQYIHRLDVFHGSQGLYAFQKTPPSDEIKVRFTNFKMVSPLTYHVTFDGNPNGYQIIRRREDWSALFLGDTPFFLERKEKI